MGGLGVIPVAAIITLFRRDWATFGALAGDALVVIALRWLGLWIVNKPVARDNEEFTNHLDLSDLEEENVSSSGVQTSTDDISTKRKAAQQDFDRAMRELEVVIQAQQKPEDM